MSDGFAYLDILFFAMVAAFIAFRLRSVLGRKTGNERRRIDPVSQRTATRAERPDNVVPLPDRGPPPTPAQEPVIADVNDDATKQGLTEIRLADPQFDLDHFLQGAKAAFAMIVEAFAKGEKAALRPLLADMVYAEFAGAIDAREQAGQTLTTELVATRGAELAAAALVAGKARVTVQFTTEQINVTRDAQGEVVDGDPRRIETVVDLWTFERDTRSRDPNWQLVETGAPS
jgi:predicted lipid-binding transport protein (Tim44 family)